MIFIVLALVIVGICLALSATKTEKGKKLWGFALAVYIQAKGSLRVARRMIRNYTAGMSQAGAITVETIIYIFVAILILYQLIPSISSQNTTVQAASNVSSMAKFAAGLGEWLFPLFGILALVFMLWKQRGKHKGT